MSEWSPDPRPERPSTQNHEARGWPTPLFAVCESRSAAAEPRTLLAGVVDLPARPVCALGDDPAGVSAISFSAASSGFVFVGLVPLLALLPTGEGSLCGGISSPLCLWALGVLVLRFLAPLGSFCFFVGDLALSAPSTFARFSGLGLEPEEE